MIWLPRTVRELSKAGIYHVLLRRNESKNIFADAEDKVTERSRAK